MSTAVAGHAAETAGAADGDVPDAQASASGGRARLVLSGLLALQLVLALAAQHGRVLLDDEVGTWRAVQGSWGTILTSFDEWQTQPAYFLLAKLCVGVLGLGELALRLPALVAGLVLTAATCALVTRLADRSAGLVAAALVGLHPFVVFYSQMARGYTLAMAGVVVSLWCVHRVACGDGGRVSGPLGALARAVSVYAHLGACATVVAEVVLAALAVRGLPPERRPRRLAVTLGWVAAGGLLALALYAPLLEGMLAFRERWTGADRGGFTLGFAPLVLRVYGGGDVLGAVALGSLAAVSLGIGVVRPAERVGVLVLASGVLAVLGFYAALDTAHYPWAFARFLTPALPLLLGLAALGLRASTRRGGAVAAALASVLVVGLAYRDSARIAFGARDVAWPEVLAEVAADGPRTLVLAPVRFHAVEPYLDALRGAQVRLVRVEELPELLARGGAEDLAARPLTVLLDVVPADGLEGWFDVERLGATARLDRAATPGGATALLQALRALAERQVAFLAPLEGRPFAGHWVFWRLDAAHEHPASATLSHGAAQALLGVTSGLLGDTAAAERALGRAAALRDAVPAPGDVRSAW